MPCTPWEDGYPHYDPVALLLGYHPYGEIWWAMGLLACILLVLPSYSRSHSTSRTTLSEMTQLFLPGSMAMGGEGVVREVGSASAALLSSRFKCNECRSLILESCFCPFVSKDFTPRWASGRWMGRFPNLWIPLSCDDELWNTYTLCTYFLTLSLDSASMCTSHPGPIAVSAPPICPVGVVPWPFTAIMPAGAMVNARLYLQLPYLPFPHLIFPVCSDRSTFRCLKAWISQRSYVLTGSPLLNYSCPSCNFKGRYLSSYTANLLTLLLHQPWTLFLMNPSVSVILWLIVRNVYLIFIFCSWLTTPKSPVMW